MLGLFRLNTASAVDNRNSIKKHEVYRLTTCLNTASAVDNRNSMKLFDSQRTLGLNTASAVDNRNYKE